MGGKRPYSCCNPRPVSWPIEKKYKISRRLAKAYFKYISLSILALRPQSPVDSQSLKAKRHREREAYCHSDVSKDYIPASIPATSG
jgi:hypothetical protein